MSGRGELLYKACLQQRVSAVRRLLRGITATDLAWAQPGTGWTALHVAAEMRSPTMIELLIGAGAPVDAIDVQGWTPLFVAVDADIDAALQDGEPMDLRTVAVLLRLGADRALVAHDGRTAEDVARQYRCGDAVRALSKRRPTTG